MAALVLPGASAVASPSGGPDADVIAQAERVADYQLAHPSRQSPDDWVQGAFYSGLCALDQVSTSRRYRAALQAIGERNGWRLGPRVYHADDWCVGQSYLYLYRLTRDPRALAAMQERANAVLAHPPGGDLAFVGQARGDRWSWCDSLFMAPPGWVQLAEATGDRRYLAYAVDHWWQTSAYLFDPAEHLFFRDSTYFGRREANGQKIFWSRGNGWVIAGLAHMLDHLPAAEPSRGRFEEQFRAMAERLLALQRPDGFWAASLLDPARCQPADEASGTGFFCFAFAWGVNHGELDAARFAPAARRAWRGLTRCVEPSGRLNHVQPIGAAPLNFPAEATEAYGVGAFLLAASQVANLPTEPGSAH
jgi:rhamnogalacturonyl hydrolase YesR